MVCPEMLLLAERRDMSIVKEMRIELGWNLIALARKSGLNRQTVARAETGLPIEASSAKKIAVALEKAHKRPVTVKELKLNIV